MKIQEILAELKECVSNLEAFVGEEASEPKDEEVKFHKPADDEYEDADVEDEEPMMPPSFGGGRKARVANYEKSRKNIRKAMKEEE